MKVGRVGAVCYGIFLVALVLFAWNANRGVDSPSWRESDGAAIARNYFREGMRFWYPQIDWRGAGPGYVESEFPMQPYAMALAYQLTGVDERAGRILSVLLMGFSLLAFSRLARDQLDIAGAVAATAFFALNPLVVELSTALKPEPWLLLFYICSIWLFSRWVKDGRPTDYWLAAACTALAILAKLNALVLGLVFLPLVLSRRGLKAVADLRLWLFACLALTPAAVWYIHAHDFWTVYGNSLGLSNEYHWFGLDLLATPGFLLGIAKAEVIYVWLPAGALLAVLGRLGSKSLPSLELIWFIALLIYYIATARTSADGWAYYYHVLTVPLASLIIGRAVSALVAPNVHNVQWLSVALLLFIAGAAAFVVYKGASRAMLLSAAVGLVLGLGVLFAVRLVHMDPARADMPYSAAPIVLRMGVSCVGGVLLALAIFDAARKDVDIVRHRPPHPDIECARLFSESVPADALVLLSGGTCTDEFGRVVAYNRSNMFYWMDRQGMNLCVQEHSSSNVAKAIEDGAEFFIADREALMLNQPLESALRAAHSVEASCGSMLLFDLRKRL